MKAARDHALGYGAAARKVTERVASWAVAVRTARELGASTDALRDIIAAGAARGGVPTSAIPAEVWRAAGLKPPTK